MNIDLSGRTILVTGAGSGIGAACARRMFASGANVLVNDLRPDAAESVAAEVAGQVIVGDVGDPEAWLDRVARCGPLHGIVSNAGYDLSSPFAESDRVELDRLLRVMVTGPFQLCRRLVPSFAAAGGCILFVASVHALATEPGMSAYAAAKGALVSLVRSAAQDLGPQRIRVLAVSPGYVDTPLMQDWIDSTLDPAATRCHADALHPLGRMGYPEDVASLIAFLMSDQAEFMNGVNIVIDGGLTAQLMR